MTEKGYWNGEISSQRFKTTPLTPKPDLKKILKGEAKPIRVNLNAGKQMAHRLTVVLAKRRLPLVTVRVVVIVVAINGKVHWRMSTVILTL